MALARSQFVRLASSPYRSSYRRILQTRSRTNAAMTVGAGRDGAVISETLQVSPEMYPAVRRGPVTDTMHGHEISDPYRWLEDPDSEETRQFVQEQNLLTDSLLEKCETREKYKAMMTKLYNYEKFTTPSRQGDRYVFRHNTGLQNQYVLKLQETLDADAVTILDPNTLSEDGTIALGSVSFTEDGSTMAYTLSSGGSDWVEIHFLRIGVNGETEKLPDVLKHVKFTSLEWTHDGKGLFYNRYVGPEGLKGELGTETDINENQQLCFHKLGAPQEQDAVIWIDPEHPQWMCHAEVSDDGRFLILYTTEGCLPVNRVSIADLDALPKDADGAIDFGEHDVSKGKPSIPLTKLVDNWDASYSYVANDGSSFTWLTNLSAPKYRVVRCDVSSPTDPASWDVVVPESEDVLQSAVAVGPDGLFTNYLRDVKDVLQVRSLKSGALAQEVTLPGVGTVSLSGRRKHREFFMTFVSFTDPGSTYRGVLADDLAADVGLSLVRRSAPEGFDPEEFVTTQEFVTGKDGTRIPMFVMHRRDRKLDGSAISLLYGYGGFNISLRPSFGLSRVMFALAYDGVAAVANIRGGGEYGIEWRNQGSVLSKQNCFDDFQSCAEHLIAKGYTAKGKIAIEGGSNGGLLVAACCNQRPDLFGCVIAKVGVMDMLRFHKFTIGHAWKTDFGDPDKKEHFEYILKYSPLHNVKRPENGTLNYPAVLLCTADHDDRVVPLHSFKLAAELQHQLGGHGSPQRNPLVIRIEVKAGHGAGKPTAKIIQETADCHAFVAKVMGAEWALG